MFLNLFLLLLFQEYFWTFFTLIPSFHEFYYHKCYAELFVYYVYICVLYLRRIRFFLSPENYFLLLVGDMYGPH